MPESHRLYPADRDAAMFLKKIAKFQRRRVHKIRAKSITKDQARKTFQDHCDECVKCEDSRSFGRSLACMVGKKLWSLLSKKAASLLVQKRMPNDALWKTFHEAGFDTLWYASTHPVGKYKEKHYGPRWHAGVGTGKNGEMICVMQAETKEEEEKYLSPGGWTPEEAIKLALEKLYDLAQKR